MKVIVAFFMILFCVIPGVFSQTGPGGVGSVTGSSSLKLWLRADDLNADGNLYNNPSNGTAVSSWNDLSGCGNNFVNSGINRPSYLSSGPYKAVYFDASLASAQYLNISTSGGSYVASSAFFAINPVNSGNSNSLFDNSSYSLRIEQFSNTNKIGYTRYGVSDYSSSLASPFGINSIVSYHKQASSSSLSILSNATSASLNIGSSTAGIPYDRIGGVGSSSDEASGSFYEVILYNSQINNTEIILVNNYLSAKYGSISIQNDIYDKDNASNGNYDYDVAGIGRISSTDLHNDSKGTGIVEINNPTGLDNNEFLIWGHDNGALQADEKGDVPVGVEARLMRVWRVSEVSTTMASVDVGAIDITWDLSGLGPVNASDLRLLIDSDNDGLFSDESPIAGAVSAGGSSYRFNAITAIKNNVRFTLGTINKTQTPLPVELLYFKAGSVSANKVGLEWATASETNNDYFTLERSTDMLNWEVITHLAGSGNSTVEKKYEYLDDNPISGGETFYRLKQTDFDGGFSYSGVITVNTSDEKAMVNVYPNPTAGIIDVEGDEQEMETIGIYSSAGQNITGNVSVVHVSVSHVQLDLGNFPDGLYYIRTSNRMIKVVLKKI